MSVSHQISHSDDFLISIIQLIDEISKSEVIACYKLAKLDKLQIAHYIVL